jgi:hypothetical protein
MLVHLTGIDSEVVPPLKIKVGSYRFKAIVPSRYIGVLSLIVPPPPREVICRPGLFVALSEIDKEPVVTSGVSE